MGLHHEGRRSGRQRCGKAGARDKPVGGVELAVRIVTLTHGIHPIRGFGVQRLPAVEAAGRHQVGLDRPVDGGPLGGITGEIVHRRSVRQRFFRAGAVDSHRGPGVGIDIGLDILAVAERDNHSRSDQIALVIGVGVANSLRAGQRPRTGHVKNDADRAGVRGVDCLRIEAASGALLDQRILVGQGTGR